MVNEVYNSNWKPKIDYNKTILSQCYEQMKDHLLPLLYSLITGDEDIKLSILQFLYTFINNQTINNFSITDYGGIKVLLDCIRIWDKTSNINLLKMCMFFIFLFFFSIISVSSIEFFLFYRC